MTCAELIAELDERGARVWLESGRMRVSAPRGALSDELRGILQSRKEELRAWLEEQAERNQPREELKRVERQGPVGLSYAQRRLWFLYRLEGASATYNIPIALRFNGKLDASALRQAIEDVVARQETLRTIFPEREGTPFQLVLSPDEAHLQFVYEAATESDLQQRLEQAANTALELDREIPLRVWLFHSDSGQHVLLLLLHHIAGDGWSMRPLLQELGQAYAARVEGKAPGWEALEVQYRDFAQWQHKMLGDENDRASLMARQIAFWRRSLEGAPEELALPADRARPQIATHRGGTVPYRMSRELHRGLAKLGRNCGASLFMVLAAGLSALLSRLGAGEDIVIGTVVAGRGERALEALVGLFVNTLVLRTAVSGEQGFAELVKQVRRFALEAYARQDVPFERLVEALQPSRSLARHPLFQVMLVLQNTPEPVLEMGGLHMTVQALDWDIAKFDLTVSLNEQWTSAGEPDGLHGVLQYSRDLFDERTAEAITTRFIRLLEAAVADPERAVGRLDILSAAERRTLLEEFNSASPEVAPRTLVDLFEQQVANAPQAEALTWGDRQLSYGELDQRANRLAHYLISEGIGPEKLVGICLDRSFEMIVAILGVQKAGGAYLPLDADYPAARLAHMITDAAPALVLTSQALRSRIPTEAGVIELDSPQMRAALDQSPDYNPHRALLPQHPAYVIYTSGSTGTPKGVLVTHQGIAPIAAAYIERMALSSRSRVLQFASLNFDASVLEMVAAFSSGAALVLIDDPRNISVLQGLLLSRGVTHTILPLAVLSALEQETRPEEIPLDCLIVGGEACPRAMVARWAPKRRMLNFYGPTEATISATVSLPLSGDPAATEIDPPLGSPIHNTRVYVLDPRLEVLPVGVAGELYIAGAGLARGYLNRPGLTAERFVADPNSAAGGRLYRTGDIARWRSDGTLEFIGRADQQIKIRGFRVELGEIEAVLLQQPQIAQAAVVLRDDLPGGKQLVAYVIASKGSPTLDFPRLRQSLSEHLPDHMVPGMFVALDRFPLTGSAKLDRRQLPRPELPSNEGWPLPSATAIAGGWESVIAEAWRAALGVPNPGVNDNFFHLGGHSLLLAQVHSRLQNRLQNRWKLPLVKLFEHPTIASLAKYLDQNGVASTTEADAKPQRRESGDMAIIGMACRFPQAASVEAFWDQLLHGVDSITPASSATLEASATEFVRDPHFVNAMGRLDNIDMFDAALFGLTPLEAAATDPQQRLLLECAWEALESAGHNPEVYGKNIGVFAGSGESHYRALAAGDPKLAALGAMQLVIGTGKDHLAPRLSYMLNLQGPSVPVNTACSTSLVAVHLACQSVLDGECEIALAGACSIAQIPQTGYLFQEGGILSPDGHCRAFDEAAQGTVPGSGAGVIVLKRLEKALADGDRIRAVIKGSAINNDGSRKVGYTAPSVEGQRQVIRDALDSAGVRPTQISYIEAHGTATPLGDPIEIEALRQVFAGPNPDKCAIGSVKTNIGHCDAAAGIAGLIKTVLCLENRMLVPSLHFVSANPQLDLEHSPFQVVTEAVPWQRAPRFAGVSSFGIGGTNAHVVLQEAPPPEAADTSCAWAPFVLSAQSESALERRKEELANFLETQQEWVPQDIAFTLNLGRKSLPVRQAFAAAMREDVRSHLRDHGAKLTHVALDASRSVVFLFPGQGKLHLDLARDLYRSGKRFRSEVDHCCERFAPLLDADLAEYFANTRSLSPADANRPSRLQPILFTIEYALAQLWMSRGVRPAAMLGHSLGDYVAATLAGVLRLEDALALVAKRARGAEDLPEGSMVAIPATEADLRPRLNGTLSLAAMNAPAWCVVSGPRNDIDRLVMDLRSLHPIRIDTTHAFHSASMDPLMEPLTRLASGFQLNPPTIPYLSNVTGTWIRDDEATDPSYWARHLRQPVRFSDALRELVATPGRILLEVGPGTVLCDLARHSFPNIPVVASLGSVETGEHAIAKATATLAREGAEIDWRAYYRNENRKRVLLPSYPFERQSYWPDPAPLNSAVPQPASLEVKAPIEKWLYSRTWKRANPRQPRTAELLNPSNRWVVFSHATGIAASLARKLEALGQHVTEVRSGHIFDARSLQSYAALFDSVPSGASVRIIHGWGLERPGSTGDGHELFANGFDSLLRLSQGLTGREFADVQLTVLLANVHRIFDEEVSTAPQAASLGIIHVLPKEMTGLRCRGVDIDAAEPWNEPRFLDTLLTECASAPTDAIVAYRRGQRWVPLVEAIDVPEASSFPGLRSDGVYVILRGLQELGFALAERLVQKHGSQVILVDRSYFPEPEDWPDWLATQPDDSIARKIVRLRDLGSQVRVMSASLTDREQMMRVKTKIEGAFGRVSGVFHLDRPPGAGLIQGISTVPLESLIADAQELASIDFTFPDIELLALFATNLAEGSGLGQVEQAARDAMLSTEAERLTRSGKRAVCIAWGTEQWRDMEAGNAEPSFIGEQLEEKRRRFGMTLEECVEALERGLATECSDVIVSTRDFEALMEQQHLFTASFFQSQIRTQQQGDGSQNGHSRRGLPFDAVAPRTEVEKLVVEVWKSILGFSEIGVTDNFFELGGHSLLAVQLLTTLNKTFATHLTLKDVFEAPTIAQFSRLIAEPSGEGGDDDADLDALLAEIESMSDTDVKTALLAVNPNA